MKRHSSGDRLPAICFVLTAKDLGLHADMAGSPLLQFADFIGKHEPSL
jgi:hypothetical protein